MMTKLNSLPVKLDINYMSKKLSARDCVISGVQFYPGFTVVYRTYRNGNVISRRYHYPLHAKDAFDARVKRCSMLLNADVIDKTEGFWNAYIDYKKSVLKKVNEAVNAIDSLAEEALS